MLSLKFESMGIVNDVIKDRAGNGLAIQMVDDLVFLSHMIPLYK